MPRVLHFSAFHCILDCGLAHLVQSCTILHPNVLNLSDHLPITVNLNLQTPTTATPLYKPKFNWRCGVENGSVEAFAADVTNFLSSLLQAPIPSSLEELDQEIIYVGKMLHGVACNTVPVYKKKEKKFYYDESLVKKCAHNKEVWNEWKNAGKPRSGILFENLQKSKYDVKKHLRRCRGEEERKRVQERDHWVKTNDPRRYHIPRKRNVCNKLYIETYTDTENLLECWRDHFCSIGKSKLSGENPSNVIGSNLLYQSSFVNEDYVLDYDITLEEVEAAVRSLRNGKSCGIDDVSAEHLKYGGPTIPVWLKRIFNAVLTLEEIPSSLNNGLVIPIYKGKGRDPLNPNSYRGITVTSVIAKCLEKIVLGRLIPVLEEKGFPHPSQSAYIKERSCTDGIFSTYEVLNTLIQDGDSPFLCMFDLEKAFDSVEYDILLYHLYNYGINGKTFRIIKSWYTNPTCSVHLNQRTSRKYIVHRGVKQGSVLSPVLFNIIMDRLLQSLNKKPTNLTISNLSIGCAAHADDIRACCVGLDTVKELAVNIDNFAISNSKHVQD